MNSSARNVRATDIAQIAGVSQATVSRVLSGSTQISEATRQKVMQVVQDVGYTPNAFAQAMRTRQSRTIGVAVSRVTNPVVPEILEALGTRLAVLGRRMVVWNTDSEGEAGVIEAVRHGTVDGLIFTAASHQAASIDAALDRNVPTVLFNRPLDGVPCDQVVSTNRDGAAAVAQYLVSGGRRRIAYLSGPLDRTTLAARAEGFCEGLAAVGHPLWRRGGEDTFFDHDRFREIAIGLMQGPEPCDAIACGNDVIAFAVLNGLTAIGVSVPDDVWVVGFDGVTMSGWDVFDLTTMRQPWDVMADGAVSALIDRIECRRTSPRTIQARTDLLVRGSTAHWPATHRDALAQTTNHKGRIP